MRAILLTSLLAACAPLAPMAEPTGPCQVSEMMRGRHIGTRFREAKRELLQREANARTARVLRPDVAATMDLRPDRLDILVDEGGQIEGLRCG